MRKLSQILGELAGAASLCWNPKPAGVFDSTLASEFVDKALAEIEPSSRANNSQVGGKHYKGETIEHWDYCWARKFDFFQYQITKYVERWRKKGGVQDLKKAQHFLQKYIEVLEAGEPTEPLEPPPPMPDWMQYVKPTGWVSFIFEGADDQGFHYRCDRCRLRLPGIAQFQPPWEVHDATKCEPFKGSLSLQGQSEPQGVPLPPGSCPESQS